jgi:hypothetical protein
MREFMAEHATLIWIGVGVLVGLVLVFVTAGRRRAGTRDAMPLTAVAQTADAREPAPQKNISLDAEALSVELADAEANGHKDRLPTLYLSLARCRLETGANGEAEAFLRKSILGAGAQQKQVHAEARLALGDLAHEGGDPTTACEHWQIARALFHELGKKPEHEATESRMLRNGCPTDWVLTDF